MFEVRVVVRAKMYEEQNKMEKRIIFIFVVLSILFSSTLYADQNREDDLLFNRLFREWTAAFNKKDLPASCDLFSKSVIADYQGYPEKNYSSICHGFEKIFLDKNRTYQYRYKINHIYHSGDLAAVRITWYLTLYENHKQLPMIQDEGIDILKKENDGKWRIVNYLAFKVNSK